MAINYDYVLNTLATSNDNEALSASIDWIKDNSSHMDIAEIENIYLSLNRHFSNALLELNILECFTSLVSKLSGLDGEKINSVLTFATTLLYKEPLKATAVEKFFAECATHEQDDLEKANVDRIAKILVTEHTGKKLSPARIDAMLRFAPNLPSEINQQFLQRIYFILAMDLIDDDDTELTQLVRLLVIYELGSSVEDKQFMIDYLSNQREAVTFIQSFKPNEMDNLLKQLKEKIPSRTSKLTENDTFSALLNTEVSHAVYTNS